MREKHTFQKTISFTPKMADKITKAAEHFDVSFAEIVRECINKELAKLIDRENKRKKAHKKQ